MGPSEQLYELTTQREGSRQFPYQDQNGNWTVGIGHLILPGEDFSAGLTPPEQQSLLYQDMAKAVAIVNTELASEIAAGKVTQGEFDALCDAVFNMGDFLKGSTLLRLLAAGDTAGAEQQLTRWDFSGGKPNAGLEARRIAEMALWAKGDQG